MVRETRHLWVANLPDNTREDRIREHFQRYGRVQSVKIIISPGTTTVPSCQPSPTGTITSTSELNANVANAQQHSSGDHHMSSTHSSGVNKSSSHHQQQKQQQQPTTVPSAATVGSIHVLEPSIGVNSCSNVSNNNVTSSNCITMCAATIAFMDIKSASKAHLAEHKFDDRILTTEYYEPSAMHHGSSEGGSSLVINSKMSGDGAAINAVGDIKDVMTHGRFASTSSHGSSDDHSPGRTNFYDRVSTSQSGNRNTEPATEFIRRNSYHSNDIRGRQRDRHFRNNPYSLIVDRSNPISHHRLTSNTWYETSPSSSSSRNHYNSNTTNSNNNVFQQPDSSSYDRHNSSDLIDTTTAVTTSNSNTIKDTKGLLSSQTQALITNSEPPNAAPYKSKLIINNHHHHLKTIKSRSGSESPISGRSSRSHSRSPSSCSSASSHTTTPTSSHSSPASGAGEIVTHSTPSSHNHRTIKSNSTGKSSTGNSHHQRHRRNLQTSLASVPIPNSIDKPASTTSSLSSSGSVSGSNPVVHSEDNRPLAICVKNLPLRSSDTSLKDGLFHEYKKHGKVTWVKVVGQSHERYALVCFKKPEDVEKALEVSQDKLFFGCKIEVQPYQGYDVDDNEFRPYEAEIDEYQSKSTRTLFIGNLEKHVTVAELRKAFEVFGEILEIDIKKQGSSPYAFCQYADIVSVVKAVRKMDGEHFGSTRIKLGFGKSMPTTCVWLDGILDGVSEHYLTQQFSRFGTVQKVAIDRDRKTALVSFEQIQCAQQAVKETRGTAIRGRKLQVDYASRECVDAFYARLEKLGVQPANINVESLITPGNNMVRHTFNTSRSRASSFSRPGNPVSGATSPTSTPSAGSTPRHHSSSGSVGKKFRYAAAGSPEFYDSNEYLDAYGSGYDQERVIGDSDHLNDGETITITSSSRRRCDKSPGEKSDIRLVQRVDSESGTSGITSSIRRRCERSPGEMRILESQRHKILDQLEKCPSSGDETESPKKRAKYSQDIIADDGQNHHNDSSATNGNGKVLDHRDTSLAVSSFAHNNHRFHPSEMVHRKTVEIRRLSDCNIKHSASVPGGAMTSSVNYTKPIRRPSTDSLSRYQNMDSYQSMMHKRRKTSATASTSSSSSTMTLNDTEQQASKSRVNQLHSNHSFEASGGESEHGSRPGTPLFDERPDNTSDPRTPPIAGRPVEPMNLPLPKFAQQFHQQLRQNNLLLPAAHATAVAEKQEINNILSANSLHSSLNHRSISPPPQTSQIRSRSNSLMPPISSGSSNSETALTSPRPPSLLSNSSDSEQELGSITGPNSSPSLDERLKKFSDDYESWSSNGRSSSSSHYMNSFRHSVPEIAVPETPELLRNVLKNSMFDEDSKRLENINDKYVTQAPATLPTATVTSKNAFGAFGVNSVSVSGTLSPMLSMMNSIGSNPPPPVALPEGLTATSALSNSLGKLHMPTQQPVTISTVTMIHQRLGSSGTGSPLNSPNTASPYNSPNPSSASSISSIKGLQYPFPTHPALNTNAVTLTTNTSSVSASVSTITSVSSVAPMTASIATVTASSCPKPKTSSALGKSLSLQEVAPATISTSATGNNNNSNNFNKSSTNNNNVNNSNAECPPSKLLMKSASLPNCGPSEVKPMETSVLEKIDEQKNSTTQNVIKVDEVNKPQPEVAIKKEVETTEKKTHSKDRRKNSDNDEQAATTKDEIKEHSRKDKEVSSFRKDRESKKSRETETDKKVDDKKSRSDSKGHKKPKDDNQQHHVVEDKKEEAVVSERALSPQRKRRVSFEDVSSVDSASELQPNHVENNKTNDKNSKDSKHHDSSKSNSKHHHHHNHKDKKSFSKEKSHGDEENQTKLKQNDVASSKDSIFDELKRNSKDNIIKTSEKIHKSKKHHHHYHRENSTKDKENQTQVNNFNDTSSSIMTEDVGRSSEDEDIHHRNHNHKEECSEEREKRSNHEHHSKSHPESSEEGSGKKKYPRRSLNASLSTDDTDDSEGNRNKTSFFDIPDEAPNISMYDKVKARSCKNLKKQEEEKKIKDKFSALKQSRAKRERKRLNTSDEDSDSDMNDGNSNDMFQMKFKRSQLSGSEEDDKDSENEQLRKAKNRNQFSVCDDESSESGITINDGHRKRNKFSSRKMSRTNVIDSSDDDMPTSSEVDNNKHVEIKQEPSEFQPMVTSDFDDLKKPEEHSDASKNHNNRHGSNGSKKRHHDKNKDDKSSKKSKKLSRELHRKSSSSVDNNHKRDEQMDDIFGPISDDDIKPDIKNSFSTVLVDIKKEPVDDAKPETSEIIMSKEQQREESRKRKEKRRREREKQRAIKEEDNSVDLDEAGRALEAQLMSDSEQKLNNNEPSKEMKSDDVFRFTDGDDEMKRDHHDGAAKKKKKKKRAKEERKHHHHHYNDSSIKEEVIDNSLESSGTFNNNNNTKIRLDVISSKPSVPLLREEAPPVKVRTSVEPVVAATSKKEIKPKADVIIPGFGSVVDETVHQKAVLSIAKELEKKPPTTEVVKVEKVVEVIPSDSKLSKPDAEKVEEKSRVVISQEETEDAVAALLGESFGMVIEDEYPYDEPMVNNDSELSGSAMIPPEEDEEMKKAILSLNPDMEHKPETPQSEHELQIDTDNDDPAEEEESGSQSFDNPPKTPDVDLSQLEKEKIEPIPEPEVVKVVEVKTEKVVEKKAEIAPSTSKVEPPKQIPPTVKEEVKAEKQTEKKDIPNARPVISNYTSRLHQAPTITIPPEPTALVQSLDRISPRVAKQISPVTKSSPHLSPVVVQGKESSNHVNKINIITPPAIITPTQKMTPSIVNQPGSPKIIPIPNKVDIKPILIHPPGAQSKINTPIPVQQPIATPLANQIKTSNTISSQQTMNKDVQQLNVPVVSKFIPMSPAEKKKVEAKPNNSILNHLKPVMPPAQQHLILQQTVQRQPQIIFPPSTSGIIPQPFVKATQELPKAPTETKDSKLEQWQQNASSVIQKTEVVKDEQLKVDKKHELESSHDEDDFDDTSPDNSMERESGSKKGRGTGRQQRGRKGTNAVQSPTTPEDPAGIQTRRGGKTPSASKRGRGSRAISAKTIVPPQNVIQTSMPSPAPVNHMREQKTSESDVYEFHDDSGEEPIKTADASRPRLIMTIKSSTVTTSVNTQPIMSAPASTPTVSTVVQSTPVSAPVIQAPVVQPTVNEPTSETQLMIPPSPNSQQVASPAHSDDFAQPNNTRKSRRLQEKDGTRTSVDDTIDDVIRNIAPNQAQQANNRRATRQTTTPVQTNVVAATAAIPSQNPQILVNLSVDVKKSVKPAKKQKDRLVSETSESETEKKTEIPLAIPAPTTIIAPLSKQSIVQEPQIVQQQTLQQPPQISNAQVQRHPEMMLQKPHPRESSELLQLIDPVTGELQKMTQSKEGQYVPVSENRIQLVKQQLPSVSAPAPQNFTVEVKTEDKKLIAAPAILNVIKASSPVVIEQQKQIVTIPSAEPTHVIKPVITQNPTYSKPQAHKTYVLGPQSMPKTQVVPTAAAPSPTATTVISSQGMMKINPIVQHPSTIYNLPNIVPNAGGKYAPPSPKTIVMPAHQNSPTIIHQNPSQIHQALHQKIPTNGQQPQIVIHSQQPHPMMQSQQQPNLMINIPTSSAVGQSVASPRMQVKQIIQRSIPSQIPSAGPPTTIVLKTGQPPHVLAAGSQDPKTQTTYIQQGTKIVQGPPEGPPMSYLSGAREIIYVGGKQTIYPNYPPNKYGQHQPIPSPTQPKAQQIVHQIPQQSQQHPKIMEKGTTQPSVSVTHIQMPLSHQQQQQKVYFTNSGPVITNIPTSAGQQAQEANERHQQWLSEKMHPQQNQPQPLKGRYVMEPYDEAHRAQIQSEQRAAQSQGQVKRSYVIEGPGGHQHISPSPSQPNHHGPNVVNQPIIPPQNKTVIGLNQTPQILTGAVASPPLKPHLTSQQPVVTGASSSRVAIPPISPKDQHLPRHYPPEGYEESVMQHGDRSAYRSQSPPPAHQTSPLTTRPPYLMTKIFHHQQQPSNIYMRGGPEFARLPSRIEQRELPEVEEHRGASPPLELRRTTAMPLQSPGDRITDSPMITPLYLSPRIPQPYFYDGEGMKPMPVSEPPPAHRPASVYSAQPNALPPPTNLSHLQREREHREKDEMTKFQSKDADGNLRYQIMYKGPPNQNLVAPTSINRPIQLTTPPIASQVPQHADSLSILLERYPLMWQGLLALKTEQAAVQMHFVFGNKKIAKASLPFNSDHTTPPLRIAQRMRLEQSQIEGVARKMQITDEHCVLLALPCGFNYDDVLRQTENLQVSFINYLQQKQAAGIINIADPGSQNASYVVHIFPSCEFANESLERIAPDLMYKVANISHLLIVIATV